jgi:CRP/FNR family transcriptional regulator, cyclic AMP receptor protein
VQRPHRRQVRGIHLPLRRSRRQHDGDHDRAGADRRLAAKDKEVILADLPAGEIIGEMAVLDGKPRSADGIALTNVELLVLDRREFMPFLEEHPKVCLKLLAQVCAKVRLADERMADIGFVDMPARLAKALLRYAPPEGSHKPFKVGLKQHELAEMIGGS